MTIEDMHYDFKKKSNKIDSSQNKNLLIPEIDWTLNEAHEIFIKLVLGHRTQNLLGFEKTQRSIDDIRTLIVNNKRLNIDDNTAALPENYLYYVSSKAEMRKGNCRAESERVIVSQHDDTVDSNTFYNSSFLWRELNITFNERGIKLHTTTDFTVSRFYMSYIKKYPYLHNAKNFSASGYRLPSGELLRGTQNSILPEHTHREIVDIAVLINSGEITNPDYQVKLDKLRINNLR